MKQASNMAGGLAHDFRERETPNANERKTNYFDKRFAQSVDEGMARWREALPEKIHKRATLGDDIFIGCSPDSFRTKGGYEAYLKDAIQMFVDKHGPENIISASIHYDETTPHAHVKLVPIKENGKISHDHFYGDRKKLAALQTQLYEEVGQKHGLERGVEKSRAKHQEISRYYGNVKKADRLREKGREVESVEQSSRDRAKVEYTVQRTRELEADNQQVQRRLTAVESENRDLKISMDKLTAERDTALGQAAYIEKERDQSRKQLQQLRGNVLAHVELNRVPDPPAQYIEEWKRSPVAMESFHKMKKQLQGPEQEREGPQIGH